MPKKKLTKRQVIAKYKKILAMTYDLGLDKMGHPDSLVPQSSKVLLDQNTKIQTVLRKFGMR
jgi:hypothetical protein